MTTILRRVLSDWSGNRDSSRRVSTPVVRSQCERIDCVQNHLRSALREEINVTILRRVQPDGLAPVPAPRDVDSDVNLLRGRIRHRGRRGHNVTADVLRIDVNDGSGHFDKGL